MVSIQQPKYKRRQGSRKYKKIYPKTRRGGIREKRDRKRLANPADGRRFAAKKTRRKAKTLGAGKGHSEPQEPFQTDVPDILKGTTFTGLPSELQNEIEKYVENDIKHPEPVRKRRNIINRILKWRMYQHQKDELKWDMGVITRAHSIPDRDLKWLVGFIGPLRLNTRISLPKKLWAGFYYNKYDEYWKRRKEWTSDCFSSSLKEEELSDIERGMALTVQQKRDIFKKDVLTIGHWGVPVTLGQIKTALKKIPESNYMKDYNYTYENIYAADSRNPWHYEIKWETDPKVDVGNPASLHKAASHATQAALLATRAASAAAGRAAVSTHRAHIAARRLPDAAEQT